MNRLALFLFLSIATSSFISFCGDVDNYIALMDRRAMIERDIININKGFTNRIPYIHIALGQCNENDLKNLKLTEPSDININSKTIVRLYNDQQFDVSHLEKLFLLKLVGPTDEIKLPNENQFSVGFIIQSMQKIKSEVATYKNLGDLLEMLKNYQVNIGICKGFFPPLIFQNRSVKVEFFTWLAEQKNQATTILGFLTENQIISQNSFQVIDENTREVIYKDTYLFKAFITCNYHAMQNRIDPQYIQSILEIITSLHTLDACRDLWNSEENKEKFGNTITEEAFNLIEKFFNPSLDKPFTKKSLKKQKGQIHLSPTLTILGISGVSFTLGAFFYWWFFKKKSHV